MGKPQNRMTKEEREAEFVAAVEQIIGATLPEWQKQLLLLVRAESLAGRRVILTPDMVARAKR